jgi:hypothetical protein
MIRFESTQDQRPSRFSQTDPNPWQPNQRHRAADHNRMRTGAGAAAKKSCGRSNKMPSKEANQLQRMLAPARWS